jgi:hypothetical protein
MPTQLPPKTRVRDARAREANTVESIDWLALWVLSISACAIFIAAFVFFSVGDASGASMVLFGAAGVTGVALYVDAHTGDRRPPVN